MTSAAPARKPYRKAPPQHRETRHALPVAPPPPAPQHDISQVKQHTLNTPPSSLQHPTRLPTAASKRPQSGGSRRGAPTSPLLLSDSELEVSSLSSLELCVPPTPFFSSPTHWPTQTRTRTTAVGATRSHRHAPSQLISGGNVGFPAHRSPTAARKHSPTPSPRGQRHNRTHWTKTATPPKSILKQPASLGVEHAYDIIRKSKSVELLDDSRGRGSSAHHPPAHSLDRTEQRAPASRRSSDPPAPCRTNWNWKMQVLEEKVRFSNFLDEITCRVMSPAHLMLLRRTPSREQESPAPQRQRPAHRKQQAVGTSAERTRRWDNWVAAMRPSSWYQPLQEEGLGQETQHLKGVVTEEAGPKQEVLGVNRGVKMEVLGTKEPQRHKHRPLSNQSLLSHIKVGERVTAFLLLLPPPCSTFLNENTCCVCVCPPQ